MRYLSFLALIVVLVGCEKEPADIVLHPESQVLPTPDGCVPSKVDDKGECRSEADGTFQIPECCGLKR